MTVTCDLCQLDFSEHPEVQVLVRVGAEQRDWGRFCSRACAVHALVSSMSKDFADGDRPTAHRWRRGELVRA